MNPGLTLNIVEGSYFSDILDQPAALGRALRSLESADARAFSQRILSAKRVILTAMGGSLYALYPLHLSLIESGIPSVWVEAAELLHYQQSLLDGSLLVIVSQSGRSAEIVQLVEIARGRAPILAVTNDRNSALAEAADPYLFLDAGPEATVSCKTYITTLLQLAWLSAAVAGTEREALAALASAPSLAESYLANWRDHVNDAGKLMGGIHRVFFAGRGPSIAAAETSGLIVKESTRFCAEGMSTAAFRHGPFETIGETVQVLVFEGLPRTAGLNQRLIDDINSAGGRAALVGNSAGPGFRRIPEAPPAVQPILEILPVEMLTLAIAAQAGIEAGRFTRATKITDVE